MRLVYFGSPAAAVPPLCALHGAGHDIALVVTQPDRRRGRRSVLEPTAVKRCAAELGLAVRTPQRSREVVDEVAKLDADLGVVVAFGQLLPAALLQATAHGFVNVHFSLLPRWRGAAPVERAILAGDRETGVAVMAVEEALDTGGIYAEVRTPIGDEETAGELRSASSRSVPNCSCTRSTVCPAPRRRRRWARPRMRPSSRWRSSSSIQCTCRVAELARFVRAGNPAPGVWCAVGGRRLKVLRAGHRRRRCGRRPRLARSPLRACSGVAKGGLQLDEVQPKGRGRCRESRGWPGSVVW